MNWKSTIKFINTIWKECDITKHPFKVSLNFIVLQAHKKKDNELLKYDILSDNGLVEL